MEASGITVMNLLLSLYQDHLWGQSHISLVCMSSTESDIGTYFLAGEGADQLCLAPLYWESSLVADVNANLQGPSKPTLSKLESALGSAMGITMIMAMITTM